MDTEAIKLKEKILKYLKIRRDSITSMMWKRYRETNEIDSSELEVFFTYNAIISDIKNDRLEN